MRRSAGVLLLALALLLGGCWDRTEMEDSLYVASIGVDPGGANDYYFTFRVVEAQKLVVGMLTAVPEKAGGLAGGTISVRATSLEQAVMLVQPSTARIISLDHVRWVGVSAQVAEEGLSPLLDQFLRHNQIRRGASLYVVDGLAVEAFMNNQPVADQNAMKFFGGLRLVQKRLHLAPPLQLQHFYSRLMGSGVDPTLALMAPNLESRRKPGSDLPPVGGRSFEPGEMPRAGGNPVEHMGTAVFRGDRLVGKLTVDQTSALLALRGEMGKVYISVPDPREEGIFITLRLHQENKPQFRASFVGGRPAVSAKLQFEGELLSTPGKTEYTDPRNRRALEKHIAKFLKESSLSEVVAMAYHEWGADPVGFGQLFRTRFPTHDAWLRYDWPKHVKDIEVNLEVELFIRRFGAMLEDPAFAPGR